MRYSRHLSTRETNQSEPIPGTLQVPNSAGGFTWQVDRWERFRRFLVLGNEGGSYYASERQLTKENSTSVLSCAKENGKRAVDLIVEISDSGRAPKNDPALFALALIAGEGTPETRAYALSALHKVARIGTHLYAFVEAHQQFRGWGRRTRRAVAEWYTKKNPDQLAYQAIKYPQRNGWTHRDLLRLSHPMPTTPEHGSIFRWITQGVKSDTEYLDLLVNEKVNPYIVGMERLRRADDVKQVVSLILEYRLPREAVENADTKWLKEPAVWEALLEDMPLEAMVRNLGVMSARELLTPLSSASQRVVDRLGDIDRIRKSRMHPIKFLAALLTYQSGRSRGGVEWTPVQQVVDALDRSFYVSFGNVESSGKRIMLALDVSGSMSWGSIAGVRNLTPRVGSAAMALVTAAREPNHVITAFSHGLVEINISPRQRLDDVCRHTDKIPMGGTDCALPMLYALKKGLSVDAFVVYTDSETWYGAIHPSQALTKYRAKTGIPAKLVVVGMVANDFSIANPNDAGQMDVVGFDTATPQVISDFIR